MDNTVELLGVPMDLGADRRGVDMGPSAIRYGGLSGEFEALDLTAVDGGNIAVPRPEEGDPDASDFLGGKAKYAEETRAVCERVAGRVERARAAGRDRKSVV